MSRSPIGTRDALIADPDESIEEIPVDFEVSTVARSGGSARTVWALRISAVAAQPLITGGAEVGVVFIAVEQVAAVADLTDLRRHGPNLSRRLSAHRLLVRTSRSAIPMGSAVGRLGVR